MTDTYRVKSPYVTLRILDQITGSWTLLGFYEGAVLPENVNVEDRDRHVRKGMVEKVKGPEAKQAEQQQVEADKAAEEKLQQAVDADKDAAKAAADEAKNPAPLKAATKTKAD